jgi:hypothetical protein
MSPTTFYITLDGEKPGLKARTSLTRKLASFAGRHLDSNL